MRGSGSRQPLAMAVVVPSRVADVLGAIAIVLASACTLSSPPTSPTDRLVLAPSAPPPSELVPELGDVLLLRAVSGPFIDHDQRTAEAQPQVTVFDDGLVVARIDDAYRAVQLDGGEMGDVLDQLELAALEPIAVGGAVDAIPFGCADCGVAIIRTDFTGETVEAAAYGLETRLPASYVSTLPYPRGLIAVSRLLDGLYDLVAAGDSVPFSGELPVVPVAPYIGG
jgi:hypothetical protein